MLKEESQINMKVFIPILLLINFLILLIICTLKNQLNLEAFLKYMYYASFVNIVLGALCSIGNIQNRIFNRGAYYNFYPTKSSDEAISDEIIDKGKALRFTAGLEIAGMIMLIIYFIFIK